MYVFLNQTGREKPLNYPIDNTQVANGNYSNSAKILLLSAV